MGKKNLNEEVKSILVAIQNEVARATKNSLTVEIKEMYGHTVEIQVDFDHSKHLKEKLINVFSTVSFGELLALHCRGRTLGPLCIEIGVNFPSDPFGVK